MDSEKKMDEQMRQDKPGAEPESSREQRQKVARDFARTTAEQPEVNALPKLDFSTFVMSLSSSAMMHLGEISEPETGLQQENLPLAKQTIDLLSLLEEKTTGNLGADENRLLKDILFELRMKYVRKST